MNFKILKLPANQRIDDLTYDNNWLGINTMELETGYSVSTTNYPHLLIVCFSSRKLTNPERIKRLEEWGNKRTTQ